jgi:hypothetical protein
MHCPEVALMPGGVTIRPTKLLDEHTSGSLALWGAHRSPHIHMHPVNQLRKRSSAHLLRRCLSDVQAFHEWNT